jgi:hypothetical protein
MKDVVSVIADNLCRASMLTATDVTVHDVLDHGQFGPYMHCTLHLGYATEVPFRLRIET